MNREHSEAPQAAKEAPLVLPFQTCDSTCFPLVGGKVVHLGEMIRAGLPVPPGFCLTTTAYALMAHSGGIEALLDELVATALHETARRASVAAAMRTSLMTAPVPSQVIQALMEAYMRLGNGVPVAVAVRSSATAEDLPFASFAGQQDTTLNMIGMDAVLDAVRRSFASLWTDRAVSYREQLGIDHRAVQMAVAVQHMVEASVAGVLFTANPLTGRRHHSVIDASPGLGEAIVSGAVNPDHIVVTTASGEIVEQRLGDKRVRIQALTGGGTQRIEQEEQSGQACLSSSQIRALVTLGAQVEVLYGVPQDIEWAIDSESSIFLTQARPITTLFPLPKDVQTTEEDLRVYFSFNVAQGVFQPFTPMGLQALQLVAEAAMARLGLPPLALLEAGHRLFLDLTDDLIRAPKRTLQGMQFMEAQTATILEQLITDPRLAKRSPRGFSLVRTGMLSLRTLVFLFVRTRIPWDALLALLHPAAARERIARLSARVLQHSQRIAQTSVADQLAMVEHLVCVSGPRLLLSIAPILGCGLGAYALAGKLLADLATPDELQTVLRGLPYNATTEMNLSLWALACAIHADGAAAHVLCTTEPKQLVQDYHRGLLPPTLQQGLATFLRTYGHRGIAEIDLGLPRWSEDPMYLLGVLTNALQLRHPETAPDVQFRRGQTAAETMVEELTRRARRQNGLRGRLVGFCLRRARTLSGLREAPKFYLVAILARARALLWSVGEALQQAKRLDAAEDIFFLTLPEVHGALAGTEYQAVVRSRRSSYQQEMQRRHVPRVLLSDGTEPTVELKGSGATGHLLRGTPASAGIVTASAHVILDPTGAQLSPGEILVAPWTDPCWTPLFLTAGGLVMEMGGALSHGAVVAREFGIPAVVGVAGATERITTGQRISVDGSAGTIALAVGSNTKK